MNLEHTLKIVISRLISNDLENEAQVKQSVILPVLRELGWDDTDPKMFKPEYSVDRGLVDYALLSHGKPQVFIEAKRIGALDSGGEEQLFGYASNRGVPLLVLTDGDRWDFYLSMAPGVPSERRFYRLELQLEHKVREYAEFLAEHLQKDHVVSGEARRNAEKRLASNLERTRAREAIPKAWQSLLKEPDEILRDLLAEKVERECGTKPELDDVELFLRKLLISPSQSKPTTQKPPRSPRLNPSRPKSSQSKGNKLVGFLFKGEKVEPGTAIGTLVEILEIFGREDPEFMRRFAAQTASKNRNLVAKNRSDLYKKSHLIDKHSKKLRNGWWLGTNLSTTQIQKHIQTACGIARVRFSSQLKLIRR